MLLPPNHFADLKNIDRFELNQNSTNTKNLIIFLPGLGACRTKANRLQKSWIWPFFAHFLVK
jgi:hypothetical protein